MPNQALQDWGYILAAILFVFGLKMLSSQATARRGNLVSSLGMLLAIIVTLLLSGKLSFTWILVGLVAGAAVGAIAATRVQMTGMPQMVALFNGFGGIASLLVGWAEYHDRLIDPAKGLEIAIVIPVFLAVLIGGVTFTGSLVAYGRLAGVMSSKPTLFRFQKVINAALFFVLIGLGVAFCFFPYASYPIFLATLVLGLALGILLTIPIGGADMPVVISLLNSYSGLAATAAGFVISNKVLIVSGSLVGASGIVLTTIMCKAMNRSLANVLFSGMGATAGAIGEQKVEGEVKPLKPHDAYFILEAAGKVVFVPGYGMAVAQAQHVVKELADHLEANGCEVSFAIHPVAGRMPGHMNVLLAEANVPYEQLVEMDDVNPVMSTVDIAIVIGANDVVNPNAREDENSPIYGMPIINVDEARTVFVLKRSMASGFSGVDNPLFFFENTRMIFGDAKETVQAMVAEFKE